MTEKSVIDWMYTIFFWLGVHVVFVYLFCELFVFCQYVEYLSSKLDCEARGGKGAETGVELGMMPIFFANPC